MVGPGIGAERARWEEKMFVLYQGALKVSQAFYVSPPLCTPKGNLEQRFVELFLHIGL